MNIDQGTVGLYTNELDEDNSVSYAGAQIVAIPQGTWKSVILGPITAIGLALGVATTPITAISDPWVFENRRRMTVTVPGFTEQLVHQVQLGRPVSRHEALLISRQIMERAERERLEFAIWEAERDVQWESER